MYVSRNKDESFYGYRDSKDLFNAIKNSQIGSSEAKNKQHEFLNKLTNIKIRTKTLEQEKIIDNLEKFYFSRQEVIHFFRDFMKCYLMQILRLNKMRLREKDLKY